MRREFHPKSTGITFPKPRPAFLIAASLLVVAATLRTAGATTYTWTNGANNTGNDIFDALTTHSNWSVTPGSNTYWVNGVANFATFGASPTPTTITVSGTITAGGLTFTASNWTLGLGTIPAFAANSLPAPFTVTLANGATASSAVAINGNNSHGLLVTGDGTFTFTNTSASNNFSDGIVVTGGATLSTGTVTSNAVFGATGYSISLNNGTLASAADLSVTHTIYLGPNAASGGGGSVAQTDPTRTLTFANAINDGDAADSLTVSSANVGKVALSSSANSYTGATNVLAGTLKLTGAGTIDTSSQVNIAAEGTFDVRDIPGYTVKSQSLTGAGGTVLGNTTLSAAATFLANLDLVTPTLHFTGDLDLSALPALTLSGSVDARNYTLATYTGNETGAFTPTNLADVAPGYTLDYGSLFPNAITLIAPVGDPVPEPASLALLSLGVAALFARRRRHLRRI